MHETKTGFIGIRDHGREGARENTGNFLHGFAARKIIPDALEITTLSQDDAHIDQLKAEVHQICFVAATTVPVNRRPAFVDNHKKMAGFLKRMNLPVVVFGLGAQAPLDATLETSEVNEDTIEFLEVLAGLGPSIAVRGEFTADLLKKYGITNVEVIGCQSAFLSCRPDFKLPDLTMPVAEARKMISVTRSRQEWLLLRRAIEEGWGMIGQSSHFEYALKSLEPGVGFADLPEDVQKLVEPSLANLFKGGALEFERYHRWVRAGFRQFYNMPDWMDCIRDSFDFACGTRFHGNMTAMQSGVPAVWVIHDSRTREFCDHLGLPGLRREDLAEDDSIFEQFERCLSDAAFDRKYPENYARLFDYLERHGADHRLAAPIHAS